MKRTYLAVGLLALALSLAACGGSDTSLDGAVDAGADPASGTCLVGTPDCNDTGIVYDGDDAGIPPSTGMCAPDMPDCVDVVVDDTAGEPAGDVFDSEAARAEAQDLLGRTETELDPGIRIARQGEEWMMLTEDYVLGRLTVELDIDDMDQWIVTAVTVELPDGPEIFTRHLR